jgi:hypothetical protein
MNVTAVKKRWKYKSAYCKDCKCHTKHAYSYHSEKGILTKISICVTCEKTDIIHTGKEK